MSINPVSDIVLDVARAADPSRSLAATERLSRLGSTEAIPGGFAGVVRPADSPDGQLRTRLALMSGESASASAPAAMDDRAKAYKGVEELVLQRLVEAMLPKEDSGLFGGGTAGDVWRSMLAEQLAKQIGKSVDLGLVKTTVGAHPVASAEAPTTAPVSPLTRRRS